METTLATLARDGFAVVPEALSSGELAPLLDAAELLADRGHVEGRGGYRDLFAAVPLVREIARHPAIRRWPGAVLGPGCVAVRGILFDKTPATNWKVAWHQDLTIAVRERLDRPGFGPWSVKAGIPHVQPPASVLDAQPS